MPENPNPFHSLSQNLERLSSCVQTRISNFLRNSRSSSSAHEEPHISISSPPSSSKVNPSPSIDSTPQPLYKENRAVPVTKEELGRATWTFLHTLAAQYPEKPTRQQKRDVKELVMAIISRMYPCKECADHFKEVLRFLFMGCILTEAICTNPKYNDVDVERANPIHSGSHEEFSQWLCHVHNVVNRSLGKLVFPCERVDARWGKLECEQRACDLQGATSDSVIGRGFA